ncbi:MAG: T9SS type A sorting domain-containing protein [Draconibacterium sp.]|nr:T9SS type A sorting domain-containing protein [Draconibacterium sp.]
MRVTGDFNKFKPTTIENITLEKGEQIMRIYFDFAFYNMGTITVKKSGTSAINLLVISENVNIYPNPSSGQLNIKLNNYKQEVVEMELFDVSGKLILNSTLTESLNNFNIESLQPGVYIIKLSNSGISVTHKFLINN